MMHFLLILVFFTLAIMQFLYYKRIRKYAFLDRVNIIDRLNHESGERGKEYSQIESLFSIFSLIKFNHPLPSMRNWAISPDFAVLIISLLDQHKPKVVLEAGSGVSTIITGYRLKALGQGKVLSLDHEAEFSQKSQDNIQLHDLQDVARVIHAPLINFDIQGKRWLWYDTDKLKEYLNENIDFLIIDGPPYFIQDLSRYPALPILFQRLSDNATIVLDDANRAMEEKILELWVKEFRFSSVEKIFTEKGACVLRLNK
ncbi:MAG: class I SAM-dependent methyltransferase [Nodosilinea sp. LVE1205-7]|jgi:predicted O-methyltransferase YrrM